MLRSGGVHGGHYYAFVRPDKQRWLRFDDERVTLETPERAMNDQFGVVGRRLGQGLGGGWGAHVHELWHALHRSGAFAQTACMLKRLPNTACVAVLIHKLQCPHGKP